MAKRLIGVYPGTFDPITHGHFDIIKRSRRIVDHLVVGVAVNAGKDPLFSLEERKEIVAAEIAGLEGDGGCTLEVRSFGNLLMHFAADCKAAVVIRGLRAVSDFDYEFQMTGMNARLNSTIETVFLMASEKHQFIASRLVKEIARLGGDISSFVSADVKRHLETALEREREGG